MPFTKFPRFSQKRSEYYTWVKRGKIGLAPLRKGAVWSMAVVDCMASRLPVIAPDTGSFPEFVLTELRYKTKDCFFYILERLLEDDRFHHKSALLCRKIAEQYSVQNIVDKFEEVINILKRRCFY